MSTAAADPGRAGGRVVPDALSRIPDTAGERAADREMAETARAIAAGTATDEARRRMEAVDHAREHAERRRLWMQAPRGAAPAPPVDQG